VRAYDTMGIDYEESRERFQEALDIILKAWSGETFSYDGKYNHITNARLSPLPYQKPHPKVRIASTTEDSFSRVGRLGFPIFLSMRGMDVDDLQTNLRDYHKAWREAGHPGEAGDISVRFPMYIAPTDEEAVEDPRRPLKPTSSACAGFSRKAGVGLGVTTGSGGNDASNSSRNSPTRKFWRPR
jgi:alkanesulfonate monooxygenase SsuD/methylene tetrahydromethanopterin reductase-like flavin-dependent oxidoreductase (luciferase family)